MYKLYRLAIALVLLSALPAWAQRLQSEVPHDTAIPPASMMVITGCEAKDQDGSALPRAVSAEGDAVRCAATLSGIPYVIMVSEDGALTIYQVEDAAHASGHAGIMALAVQNATHTTALSGTDGDYTPLAVDSTGKLGIRGTFAEDAGHTSADLGLFILCVRNDGGTALAGTDLDYIPCTTDASGRLRIAAAPANSGVDIGDVDVTSVIPGTGATSLGKAEDAGHTTGDVGVMALAVRNDTRASLAGTDLDYAPLQLNSSGDLRVDGSAVNQPVVGAAAAGAAVSGNPVRIGLNASGTTRDIIGDSSGRVSVIQNDISSALGDAASNTAVVAEGESGNLMVSPAYLFGYNGTTWDRLRTAAGVTGTGVLRVVSANNDPCQSSGNAKSSVIVNLSSTGAAQTIAASGSTIIYVCGFTITISGTTTPAFQFEYGTGANCVTGNTDVSGTFGGGTQAASGQTVSTGGTMTQFATTASQALCINPTGTSPSIQGVVTYVQQ